MKRKILMSIFSLIVILHSKGVLAFEVNVHEKITENGIKQESNTLNSSLKDIGLLSGILENVKGKEVRWWIQEGSKQEDNTIGNPPFRYLNHFYNPITNSGLADLPFYGGSSYDWANSNDWSWQVARNQYLLGLTSSTDTARKTALSNTFRALGQVTHLVQDLASPAHVRNDAHPTGDGFEGYTKRADIVDTLNYTSYSFANALTSVSQHVPKQFWDSETYTGSNPSTNNIQGLAEYTNANFASDDTIFDSNFPHPAKLETVLYDEFMGHSDIFGGFDVYRKYYLRNAGGEETKHFAYAGRLWRYLDGREEQKYTLALDDQCYKDYAQKLIPRAVGYSAGLLNYFFRGKVNMGKDPQNAGKYIIKNEFNEKMEGTFALYYDDTSENRNAVPGASWTLTINPNSPSTPITFTEPTSPAPKEKGKYILAFQGKLGMEERAVVGREVTLAIECKMAISGSARVSLKNRVGYSLSGAVGNVIWSVDNPGTRISGNNDGATLTVGPWKWWPPLFENACGFSDPKGQINITATDQVCSKTFTAQAGTWVTTGYEEITYYNDEGYPVGCSEFSGGACNADRSDSCLVYNGSYNRTGYRYYDYCVESNEPVYSCTDFIPPSDCVGVRPVNCGWDKDWQTCDSKGSYDGRRLLHSISVEEWRCP